MGLPSAVSRMRLQSEQNRWLMGLMSPTFPRAPGRVQSLAGAPGADAAGTSSGTRASTASPGMYWPKAYSAPSPRGISSIKRTSTGFFLV